MNSTSTKLNVQSLTRKEFLELLGLTGGAFDQLQHAGHVALAFGTPLPATKGRYLDLDLVAMAINLGLSASLGREISTTIVAGFFHQWASAVGHAEANRDQNFFMAVGGVGWDAEKKSPNLLLVTHGTVDQIAEDFRSVEDLVGFFNINVTDIIRRLRACAQAIGIDLDRAFFFPPDDPRFDQILTQVKRERDARIARLRRTKKKFAAAKARGRRDDISELPRVMNNNYSIALRME
jgi:lysophospholipase L1-like esterase